MSIRRFIPKLSASGIVSLLLAGFLAVRIWPQVAAAIGATSGGTRAPAVHLTTLAGEPITLEELQGRVVLLNFWATWCPPCRYEMPGFQAVYDAKRERGFVVLGVALDAAGRAGVASFLHEHGITYPVAMATGQIVNDFGGVNLLPTSFLIDRQGRIRNEVRGVFTQVALGQAVERLLAEPAGSPAEER
jgi:peroxiredoxin